ncbi:hypothetical protein HPB47_016076 [Ixodes persulcatus]|uniref:Uncharacterized protein n=1 Tax=Ixodes persulcatus TaxID=34615 RepID=A0AC60QVF8_IXOPE|nr:hypothetical protein HPB47_016076 [Ixodes persulcatus]
MSGNRKIAEGTEALRQAEKYLKTGLLKWKPDWDNAAGEYCKAATAFKGAKALQQCKDAHLKAAECYLKNGSQLEQAALVSRDMGDLNAAGELVDRASRLFVDSRSPDTAALTLERGAKWEEAAEAIGRQREFLREAGDERAVGRLVVASVLVHLARDDFVAASKALDQGEGFLEGEEQDTLSTLLEGCDQGDPDAVARALKSPFLRHMDTESEAPSLKTQYSVRWTQIMI